MYIRMLTVSTMGAALGLAACGGSDEPESGGAGPASDPVGVDTASPMDTSDPPVVEGTDMGLVAPETGFQLETAIRPVAAGEDTEWCEVVEIPGEPGAEVYVDKIEIALGPNSHHTNVMAVIPGSPADLATTVGDVVPCLANGNDPYGEGLYNIGGAAGLLSVNDFPDGVGVKLLGGQKLVVNMHYVNVSGDEVPGNAIMNFWAADSNVALKEMRRFGFYNMSIVLPPGETSSSTMECTVSQDMYVYELFRHTHRLGTDFSIWFAGGARDGEHIWTGSDWNENTGAGLDEPVLIQAGEGFRFQCDFENPLDETVTWGDTGSDEMCILYGRWYTANGGEAPLNQSCVGITAAPTPDGVVEGFNCPTCP